MTLEEVKAFYISMGCSEFHMCRENPNSYGEFKALHINPDILEEWKQEEILKYFERIEQPSDDAWIIHSKIIDLLNSTISKKEENAESLIRVMAKLVEDVSKKSAILIAENMVGRASDLHDGGFHYLSGKDNLIKQGFLYCTKMLDFECTDADNDLKEYTGWKNMKRRKEEVIDNMKKAINKFSSLE
jgi:hypothetical protein